MSAKQCRKIRLHIKAQYSFNPQQYLQENKHDLHILGGKLHHQETAPVRMEVFHSQILVPQKDVIVLRNNVRVHKPLRKPPAMKNVTQFEDSATIEMPKIGVVLEVRFRV